MRQQRRIYQRTTLFEVLTAQGRRQDWLAQQVGCSQSYVSMMKSGARPIPEWFALRASAALNLPVSALFFDSILSRDSSSASSDDMREVA